MPDPLYGRQYTSWVSGPWAKTRETRSRTYIEDLSSGTRFKPKDHQYSLASALTKQKRIASKVTKRGMWEQFKKAMKKSYNMEDAWLEGRSGSVKAIINAIGHLKAFVDDVAEADEDDIFIGNFLKDLANSLLSTLAKISNRNDLHINEGVFRNFLIRVIPEFDENDPNDWNIPQGEIDDDLEREKDKMIAWLM